MITDFEHNLAMLKAVQYTLLTNNDIISSESVLIETSNLLSEYTRMLSSGRHLPNQDNYITYNDNYTPEEKIRKDFLKIVLALNSFASMVEDVSLMTETSRLKYEMDQLTELEISKRAVTLIDKVIENISSLEHFGISEKFTADFVSRLKRYDEKISTDDRTIYDIDEDNEEVTMNEALNFLEKTLDNQISSLRLKYPKFYNEYQTARLMKNKSHSPTENQESQINYYF
ncbi:MAG: hypothetical protein C4539_20055 [Ignavibacteriales bacterium]|nr:MAG: hypothetical protein C4539_20055 [Ignavibacteriales bacterium]